MVRGLEIFRDRFAGHQDNYVLIGGTACDLAFAAVGQEFRATKDLDIVLVVERMTPAFAETFWGFVKEGGYEHRRRGEDGEMQFYRFSDPANTAFPIQLELFSRKPDFLNPLAGGALTPIPVGDEGSSLSAILLDKHYYALIRQERVELEGVASLKPEALIPLKAAAWLDLTRRKEAGESVDSKNINKHKRDVFRLFTLLAAETRVPAAPRIQDDLRRFLAEMRKAPPDLGTLNIRGISAAEVLDALDLIYGL
jgi:hypothetical protein